MRGESLTVFCSEGCIARSISCTRGPEDASLLQVRGFGTYQTCWAQANAEAVWCGFLMLSKWMTQWDALKAKVGGVAAGQSSDAVDPAGTASRSAAEGALYSFDSLENLQKRLELRDVFRDERLFQSLLPRADSPLQRWTREGPLKTRVDHWSPTSQFIPMDQQRILMSCAYAGVLVAALTTPLEVMKNKWIFSPEFQGVRSRMSTREVCRHVYRAYGWRTFFTGFGATLCTVIPANLTYFFFYEQMRYQEPPATAGNCSTVPVARRNARCCGCYAEYRYESARVHGCPHVPH